jgi:hypothetical protein
MVQSYVPCVDSAIYHEVTNRVSCTLDDLLQRLPAYSWAEVFAGVDRLSRQRTLRLRRASKFGYVLCVCSERLLPNLGQTEGARRDLGGTGESPLVEG